MIARAVNQGWDTPDAQRQRAVDLVVDVLHDPNATDRETLAAIRVASAMVQHDQSTEREITKRLIDAQRHHQDRERRVRQA